jgi:prepilin signal peptidase PulO-like enzyme (type II secretory pathway)
MADLCDTNWQRRLLWVVPTLFLGYGLLLPTAQLWIESLTSSQVIVKIEPQSWLEMVNQRTIEILFAVLFFCFGSAVGSFLNVVAYRVPLNQSIVVQRSYCPRCFHEIAFRDNLPVLGWLLLKGRCRHCQLPISARYPIVEAIVGGIFLILFFRELISGGANLPLQSTPYYRGVVWILLYPKWGIVAAYVYHCIWFVLLVTWALFAWDGNRVPIRVIVVASIMLVVPPLLFQELSIVPFDDFGKRLFLIPHAVLSTAVTLVFGAFSGIFWGYAFAHPLKKMAWGFRPQTSHRILVRPPESPVASMEMPEQALENLTQFESQMIGDVSEPANDDSLATVNQNDPSSTVAMEPLSDGASECNETLPELAVKIDEHSLDESFRDSLLVSMICTGIVVGWQATMTIAVVVMLLRLVLLVPMNKNYWSMIPAAAWVSIAALVHHLFWRQIHGPW